MSRKMGDKDIWVRTFEVTEPRKHKKGFTVYKVVSTVFPRSFPEGATKIKVWKRYNDFKKLHKELELVFRQLYLKGEFPKFPKDKVFGRFEEGLIEERRKCALTLLEFAAKYPLLFANKIFVKFFESSYSPQDFAIQDNPTNPTCNQHGNQLDSDDEGGDGGPCLIPERVWKESLPVEIESTEVREADHQSLSSYTCSSPDPAESTLLDNSPSSAKISLQPSTSTTGILAPEQPIVTTFSDCGSSQTALASHAIVNTFVPSPYTIQESRRNIGMISSASFADDFDLLQEDEKDASMSHSGRLQKSVSCLTLDTIPLSKALREPKDGGTNNHSVKHDNKKPSGFGFFDFLPIFAKKQESKVETEKGLAESLTAPYICEAAGYFAVANHYEANAEYDSAFESYKEGIQTLLTGAQNDSDHKRRVMVRKKIEHYLSKAEKLKERSLQVTELDGQGMGSPTLLSPRKKLQTLISQDSSYEDGFVVVEPNVMPSCIEELKVYKVVGSTFNNVLVVVDTTAEGGPKCHAVKVFRKSASTVDPEKPTLIPFTIPFMVQMIKWFNTEDSIILVLQYAGGGRLINFVKAYQTKHISPVTHEMTPTKDEEIRFIFDSSVNCSSASIENNFMDRINPSKLETGNEYENVSVNKNETNDSCQGFSELRKQELVPATGFNDQAIKNGVTATETRGLNGTVQSQETQPESGFLEAISNNLETCELIENSKVLIQAVSRALDKQSDKSIDDQKRKLSEPKKVPDTSNLAIDNACSSNIRTEKENKTAKPTSLALSFSRHLQDGGYNVPPFSSFASSNDSSDICNEESSPFKRMVPECCVKVWAAEIVIALEKIHNQGITFGDLDINNILLGESGHILLSYRALWNEVDKAPTWNEFSAPEVCASFGKSLWRIHPSADWWSLGAILFLLITGQTVQDVHPEGMYPQTIINVPSINSCGELISPSARTLLTELLQFSPSVRLGYYGAAEIKSHPFFEGFDWDGALTTFSSDKSIN